MHLVHMLGDDARGFVFGVGNDALHLGVDVGCRLVAAGQLRCTAKVSVSAGFEGHHTVAVTHSVSRHHRAGKVGGLLNVVASASGAGVAD